MQKMFLNLKVFVLAFIVIGSLTQSRAQQGAGGDDIFAKSMQDVWIVIGTTAGGAILGLSTLSFVDEPSEHLKNIVVGGAIGVILGVGVVAFKQASVSQDAYRGTLRDKAPKERLPGMTTSARMAWHKAHHYNINSAINQGVASSVQAVKLRFSF